MGTTTMLTLATTNCFRHIIDCPLLKYSLGLFVGFVISLGLGHILTSYFYNRIRNSIKFNANNRGQLNTYDEIVGTEKLDIPPWLVGVIERLVFTVFVAVYLPATGIAMIGWVTTKMFYNWKFITEKADDDSTPRNNVTGRSLSLAALLASLCSLFFALIGGLCMRAIITYSRQ